LKPEIISTEPLPDPFSDVANEESEAEVRNLVVPTAFHGQRIDRWLALAVPEFSRSYLQNLLARGDVIVEGSALSKASAKVAAGTQVTVHLKPTPQAQAFKAECLTLDVIFEDAHLLVINKSPGLVVHPAAGHWSGTVLNGLLAHHAGAECLPRAGIVHRLDKDTSGLMVVAKTRLVMEQLVRLIAARDVTRLYLALVHGQWKGPGARLVDQAIGRDPRNRLRMAVLQPDSSAAKPASTSFRVLAHENDSALLGCKLFTGRTHQIRVHSAWMGVPIVGDSLYGGKAMFGMQRQALHATRLEFTHPVTGSPLSFFAPLPSDMLEAMASAGLHYNPALLGPHTFAVP
jgi:23S rRNA pseudouridine1911/1915/1917 synthase